MATSISTFTKRVPPGAAGGGTLQALMDRQKAAALAKEKSMTMEQPIVSPWQGAAHVAGVVGAGLREGRADRQEAQARQELADLMAKVGHEGATPEQEAQIAVYDPQLAAQYRQEAIEARRLAAEREFQTGERVAGQDFDIRKLGEADKIADTNRIEEDRLGDENRTQEDIIADENAAEAARVAQIKSRQDAALRSPYAELEQERIGTNMPEEEFLRRKKLLDDTANANIANATPAKFGAVPPEVAAARGGDIAKHPERYTYNSKTEEITPTDPARSAQELKVSGEFEKGLIETRSTLANLDKAMSLAGTMFEGSGFAGLGGAIQRADLILKTPDAYDPELVKRATDTQAYFNIMGEQAIKAMGNTLAGATTEYEMQQFLKIMANEATPLATKMQELTRMRAKVAAYEQTQAAQVQEGGGNPDAGKELLTPAPEAGGGAGGIPPKPADIPQAEWDAMPDEDKKLFAPAPGATP